MRIYIAGPMTGKKDHNFPAFEAAAKRLRDKGHFVINPAELSAMFGKPKEIEESFKAYYDTTPEGWINGYKVEGVRVSNIESRIAQATMDADLAAVRSCDAIYLLRGWERSRGAKKEFAEAIANGLMVMLEGEDERH